MPNCVFLLSLARYRRRPEATVGARLRAHTRLRLEQRKRTSSGNVKRGAASSVLTGWREITGEGRVGLAGSLGKAETAETMPILGTSSPEPYEWSRFRYCCHNSYVPVVWAYPSSVTGKARNPSPSGKLFRVGQMIAPPAMRDLPNHPCERNRASLRRWPPARVPSLLQKLQSFADTTTFPILPVRSVFDGGPPRSECSEAHIGAQHPPSTVWDRWTTDLVRLENHGSSRAI